MTKNQSNETAYVELSITSNFSFLRGASHPEELVTRAAELGLKGISITDRNSLAGIVRAHMAAKQAGIAFAPGCRLVFSDGTPEILVWPADRSAYGRLCELLTRGKRRAIKGHCHLAVSDLLEFGHGLMMGVTPPEMMNESMFSIIQQLQTRFPGQVHMILVRTYGPVDARCMKQTKALSQSLGIPLLATGDILYHDPARRPLQDVLTCIREHDKLSLAGCSLQPNAERHLRSAAETKRLFAGYEKAFDEASHLFSKLNFSLDELQYLYPDVPNQEVTSAQKSLEKLTDEGLRIRYPVAVPKKVRKQIRHELALIEKLDYARYFLTVHDLVRFARSQNILCQGRGSAANSAVCFCLGITEVDPTKIDLLFERFISEERMEPPDIDVDFEHSRREEVIQYIYRTYGREKSGLAATVTTYRFRSAVREVGKVFGLSDDLITAISETRWGSHGSNIGADDARKAGLDPENRQLLQCLDLAKQIVGFPRHLSQHVGGFVITRDRLSSVVPIENAAMQDRTVVEWDKDDLENLGILKIDVLALGMLTCIHKAFDLLQDHYGRKETLASVANEDPCVYDMICRADTLGVFQIESRAQMSMLPRLKPRCFYDLVIEVAIVRPGPIQGDMVHPYLRRRQGKEVVRYPKEELRAVLGKTLGIPLFQEQAMNIAIVAAKFAPGEADHLRRAMATFRRVGTIHSFRCKMVDGMIANGYEREFAERCFRQIEGFGDYGFPESHAASFALLVYVSCWLKCYYPDVFCAAILNSQPMGFYAPAQLIRDAIEHSVEMREADINNSFWHAVLEHPSVPDPRATLKPVSNRHKSMQTCMKHSHAVRLGFMQIRGFGRDDAERLVMHRGNGYDSVRDLWLRSGLERRSIERLAEADCFRSLGLERRDALWAVRALDPLGAAERLPLFAISVHRDLQNEPDVRLAPMPPGEQVINDYRSLSYSLKAHPVSFVRDWLVRHGIVENDRIEKTRPGARLTVAGLVLVRQRPGSANGVVFETLEDETGIANIIVWPKIFERYRAVVLGSRFVAVNGRLQSQDNVTHLIAEHLEDLTHLLVNIAEPGTDAPNMVGTGSFGKNVLRRDKNPKRSSEPCRSGARRALPKGRNFH